MVIVKLIGGLGNQLFQYAAARRIACFSGQELKIDISGFQQYDLRNYELKHFNIVEKFAENLECKRLQHDIFDWIKPYYSRTFIKERNFQFCPQILEKKHYNLLLEGYWQSEKYFKNIEDVIRKEFTVKVPLSGLNIVIARHISEVNAVSLHVRRGDYVDNPKTNQYHGTCDLAYYQECIAKLAARVDKPHFIAFSDDPEWTRENLKIDFPVTYITHNGAEKAYEDLRLMRLCKHHIIANSSFSWWGAWLNPRKDKIVYAPNRWFNNNDIDTRDLLPEAWIKV